MTATANDLDKQARAHYGVGPRELIHTQGRIIAYCDAPQVLIETEDGEKVWWRADLTSVEQA